MVGLAGEGQNFDGNGMYVRFQTGGGSQQVSLGQGSAGSPPQFGGLPTPPLGNRPFYPGKLPPYRSDASPATSRSCPTSTAPPPPRSRRPGAPPRRRSTGPCAAARLRTLRGKIRPFGVASRRRRGDGDPQAPRRLPRDPRADRDRVRGLVGDPRQPAADAARLGPGAGQSFTEIEAELSTAQAVTPGQGQTVNVAGVEVGEISRVRLEDGKAIVTLKLEEDSVPVYNDASVLLRPKTGLKDMVAELTPGTKEAGELEDGERIPIGQTLPDVNLDEILAVLDGDTRSYLQLLLSDGARRAGGQRARARQHDPPLRADSRATRALIAEQLATPARRTSSARSTTSRSSSTSSAARTTSSPSSSRTPTPSSRRSRARTRTCARRCRSCRRR